MVKWSWTSSVQSTQQVRWQTRITKRNTIKMQLWLTNKLILLLVVSLLAK